MICVNCKKRVVSGKFCLECGWKQNKELHKKDDYTLLEVYKRWSKMHFRRVGQKSIESYKIAWNRLKPLWHFKFADIDVEDYQEIIDSVAHLSYSSQHKLKNLISLLCKYGIMYEIIKINFSKYLVLDGYKNTPKEILSDTEIMQLWNYANDKGNIYWKTARIVMCLIFTGFRPNELFKVQRDNINIGQGFIISGSKTEAGINRMVPISTIIWPYIAEWYVSSSKDITDEPSYLIKSDKGLKVDLHNWRYRQFYPLLAELGINSPYFYGIKHYEPRIVPYSCRHTFASLAYRAGIKSEIIKKMIGHTSFQFTSSTYIHPNALEYSHELQKMESLLQVEILN